MPTLPLQPGGPLQVLHRGGGVLDAGVDVERLVEREALLPFRLGAVGHLDAGFEAPEQVGAGGDEALVRRAESQVSRMSLLMPKISCITATAGAEDAFGRAR